MGDKLIMKGQCALVARMVPLCPGWYPVAQWYPGVHQEQGSQQVQGGGPPPLFGPTEATSGVPCPGSSCTYSVQEKEGAAGEGPVEANKDDYGMQHLS